jgi:hypothetical protein
MSKIAYASHTERLHFSTSSLSAPKAWVQQYSQTPQPLGFTVQASVLKPGWEGRVVMTLPVTSFLHLGERDALHVGRDSWEPIKVSGVQHFATAPVPVQTGTPPSAGHVSGVNVYFGGEPATSVRQPGFLFAVSV